MFKRILQNKYTPFWFIAFTTLIVLTLPKLIQDGMFMDAMLYTSVSHNLSQGIGSFWFPEFSRHGIAGMNTFHEQPPLVFSIQAFFFKLFGNGMYIERLYTFLMMCITALFINKFWKIIFANNNTLKPLGWIPVILWISVPVCFWSYSNNMHENTMGIFTLLAVMFQYTALQKEKFSVSLWILSGIFIFLATFSKGIPGLFPITIPFLYWITFRKTSFGKFILQSVIVTCVPILIYALLLLIPAAKESLSIYLFDRALTRINAVPTTDSHFYILGRLFMEILPQLALVLVFMIVAKFKKIKPIAQHLRTSVFFMLAGLAASAPLMLTLVQKGFYFVPALPFFAIASSVLLAPFVAKWIQSEERSFKKHYLFLSVTFVLFIGAIVFSFMQKGKTSRDREMLSDVYLIGSKVPGHSTITIPQEMWNDWEFQCYLMRYFNISLSPKSNNDFYLTRKGKLPNIPFENEKIISTTQLYDLYKLDK